MVRALVLAELAWAVENLLNRVIERSVAAGLRRSSSCLKKCWSCCLS
jgi:hypothetical protein